MYTTEENIIHFVIKAFDGMKRKKENIDMSFHSIMVGNMLKNIDCKDEIVFIGYLHDIIEDTTYTYDDILNRYGKNIADGVLQLSENTSIKDWKLRKEDFINKLYECSNDILLVELADKLQNLLSDYNLFLEKGKYSLVTEADKFENFKWFYTSLQSLFNERLEPNNLLDRYNEILEIYFK